MTQLRHLQLIGGVDAVPYTYPGTARGPTFTFPARDRVPHARAIKANIQAARDSAAAELGDQVATSTGIQLTFESSPGHPLVSDSLEDRRLGLRVLTVQPSPTGERAVVFVPRDSLDKFIRKINRYETEQTRFGQPKNKPLVESIERARLAIAKDMWTDGRAFPVSDAMVWWEVWLRAEGVTDAEAHDRFAISARARGFSVSEQRLSFPERVVTLVRARPSDWSQARLLLEFVAELRFPSEASTPYLDLTPRDQALHVEDVVARLQPATPFAPAVCVLDTGIMRLHPLLQDSVLESDALAVRPEWLTTDHDQWQHGTGMAGNALFGCLTEVFQSQGNIELTHRVESVKILPPRGATEPELYGETTAQAISRAEIAAPGRARVICMAVTDTSLPLVDGEPTSWSSSIDQLAWNNGQDQRLVCISGGNLREAMDQNYTYMATNSSATATVLWDTSQW